MKIVRYFINAENEDTGLTGYLPLWVPGASNFDPGSPVLMVHDMLEHRLCDQGHFHEELMAFGRVVALRVVPHAQGFSDSPSSNGLGSEIGSEWASLVSCGEALHIPHAPRTPTLTEFHAEKAIREIADQAIKTARSELGYRENWDTEVRPTARLHAAMLGWMRVGYLDALRRYGQQDHGAYDVGHSAFGWALSKTVMRAFEEHENPDDGTVVARLEFDTRALRMRHRFYIENDQMFPDWLRNMTHAWRTSYQRPVQERSFINA